MKTRFYGAKIAFKLPKSLHRTTNKDYPGQRGIPDSKIEGLCALFDDCHVVFEDICNPDLLIIETSEPLTSELLTSMETRIDDFLNH